MKQLVVAAAAMACLATAPVAQAQVFSKQIDQSTFSGRWPLSSTSGVLACDTAKANSVTFTPAGSSTTYAVNGSAMSWAKSQGWPDSKEISNGENWGDLIDAGLKLCGS
jgi:hypothetical protein